MKIKNRILAIILVLSMSILTAFVPSYSASAANLNSTIYYAVFDGDGNGLGSYNLNPVSTITGGDVSITGVIGDDTREVDYSKTGVVKIITRYGDSSTYGLGSGFVVDEHTIATAAHLVYDRGGEYTSGESCSGRPINKILFFNSDGTPDMTITDVSSVHVPRYYIHATEATNNSVQYDYALITVEEDLSDYMCFNLGYMMEDAINTEVSITGFPGMVNGVRVNSSTDDHVMYTGTGEVTEINDNNIRYDTDISNGNSGGPVYVTTTYNNKTYYTVVAVHTGSGTTTNGGVRINTNLLQFYLNNPYTDTSYFT